MHNDPSEDRDERSGKRDESNVDENTFGNFSFY